MRSCVRPATASGSNWIEPSVSKICNTASGPPSRLRAGARNCRATRKRRAASAMIVTARACVVISGSIASGGDRLAPMNRRISSIASAPGWKARFQVDADEEELRTVTLVSWALVEDATGDTEIVGIIQRPPTLDAPEGSLGFADEVEGFQGYAFTGLVTQPSL